MVKRPVKWVRTATGHWESPVGEVYLVTGTEEMGEWEGTVKANRIHYIPKRKSSGEVKHEVERMYFALTTDRD